MKALGKAGWGTCRGPAGSDALGGGGVGVGDVPATT